MEPDSSRHIQQRIGREVGGGGGGGVAEGEVEAGIPRDRQEQIAKPSIIGDASMIALKTLDVFIMFSVFLGI